jgi:hypothetical protein
MQKIPPGLLSVEQTALLFFTTPSRVRRWAKKGILPFIRYGDYRILFEEAQMISLKPMVDRLLGREAKTD